MKRSWWLLISQVLLVALVGGKFYWDRWNYPRGWMQTVPFDPYTPMRGRYVDLRPVAKDGGLGAATAVVLKVRNGEVWAVPAQPGEPSLGVWSRAGERSRSMSGWRISFRRRLPIRRG